VYYSACVDCSFHTGSVYEDAYWAKDVAVVEKALDIVKMWNEAAIIGAPVKVNRAEVWIGITANNKGQKFLVEPFIEHWQKWNSNSGWALKEDGYSQVMQALSHFSFHASRGQAVLCDLQGSIYKDAIVISDPAILSRERSYGSVSSIVTRSCLDSGCHCSPAVCFAVLGLAAACWRAQTHGFGRRWHAAVLPHAPVQRLLSFGVGQAGWPPVAHHGGEERLQYGEKLGEAGAFRVALAVLRHACAGGTQEAGLRSFRGCGAASEASLNQRVTRATAVPAASVSRCLRSLVQTRCPASALAE